MGKNKTPRRIIAALCVLMMLFSLFALTLPHSHECGGENCAVCALVKSSAYIPGAVVLCFILSLGECAVLRTLDAFLAALILHDGALVWLKVKLSD